MSNGSAAIETVEEIEWDVAHVEEDEVSVGSETSWLSC